MKSAIETLGAEQMASKLVAHLEEVQHAIAEECAPVCAFTAESNMIGKMAALLQERRYEEIRELLKSWYVWLSECGEIHTAVSRAAIMVETFCEFYEATNGLEES